MVMTPLPEPFTRIVNSQTKHTVPYHIGVVSVSSDSRIKSLFSRDQSGEASFLKLELFDPRFPPAVVKDCTMGFQSE